MNIRKILPVISFGAGFIAGNVSLYFLTKRKVENEIYNGAKEERDIYRNKLKELSESIKKLRDEDSENDSDVPKVVDSERKRLQKEYKENKTLYDDDVSYDKYYKKPDNSFINKPSVVDYGKLAKREDPRDAPYLITPEDYDNDETHEKYSYTFYADGILANEIDETVIISETVGTSCLEKLISGAEDVVYVRNDVNRSDYEVCASELLYSEYVEGKSPDSYTEEDEV